jgi:hypothetical protein
MYLHYSSIYNSHIWQTSISSVISAVYTYSIISMYSYLSFIHLSSVTQSTVTIYLQYASICSIHLSRVPISGIHYINSGQSNFEFEYIGEFETKCCKFLEYESGAQVGSIDRKKQRAKISCYCPLKLILTVTHMP